MDQAQTERQRASLRRPIISAKTWASSPRSLPTSSLRLAKLPDELLMNGSGRSEERLAAAVSQETHTSRASWREQGDLPAAVCPAQWGRYGPHGE